MLRLLRVARACVHVRRAGSAWWPPRVGAGLHTSPPPARRGAPPATATADRGANTQAQTSLEAIRTTPTPPPTPTPSPPPSPFLSFTVSASEVGLPLSQWLKSRVPAVIESRVEALCVLRVVQRARPKSIDPATGVPPRRRKLHHWHKMQAGEEILVRAWLVQGEKAPTAGTSAVAGVAPSPRRSSSLPSVRPRCPMSIQQKADLLARVIYEDAELLVVNKPTSMELHRRANSSPKERYLHGMLWVLEDLAAKKQWFAEEKLRAQAEGREPNISPLDLAGADGPTATATQLPYVEPYQIVSHLDAALSGIVLVAKNQRTADLLTELMKSQASEASSTAQPAYSSAIWDLPDAQQQAPGGKPFLQIRYLAICHGKAEQQEGDVVSSWGVSRATGGAVGGGTGSPPVGAPVDRSSYIVILTNEPALPDATHTPYSYLQLLPHSSGPGGRRSDLVMRRHCYQLGLPIVGEQLHQILVDPKTRKPISLADDGEEMDPMDLANAQYALSVKERMIHFYLRLQPLRPLPLFLHANELILHHPAINGGRPLAQTADLPRKFQHLIDVLAAGAVIETKG